MEDSPGRGRGAAGTGTTPEAASRPQRPVQRPASMSPASPRVPSPRWPPPRGGAAHRPAPAPPRPRPSVDWMRRFGGERRLDHTRRELGGTGKWSQPGGARGLGSALVPGDVESRQHVGGAGSRVRTAGSERARAAGGGTAAAGEEGDSVGTVGRCFEEGTPAWEWVVTVTQRGSPGGEPSCRLGVGAGCRAPTRLAKGFLRDLATSLPGFLEVGSVGAEGVHHPRK